MKIRNSLEWSNVASELYRQLNTVDYNPDLMRMIQNINKMVAELSKKEVEARRIKKPEYTQAFVEEINQAIDHVEKLLLVAKLMS